MTAPREATVGALDGAVEEIFFQALERPSDEREMYLDTVCRDDPRLRAEVASLLGALEAPDPFQEGAASELARQLTSEPVAAAPSSHPEQIGPYRLLEVLGEGGMGTVYLAEQEEPLPRRVALKLMHWGGTSDRALRRFEFEREALARMSHPTIAQVFGAGATEHGQPYVALEHVPGPPITEYCDNHRLSLRQRLQLFAAVCEGVRHAHEKAVLHRDLKPSNILVGETQGTPLPKIIDFGIAKALEPENRSGEPVTLSQMRLGSPGYMSPEALTSGGRGVDTRSDIYSLGVVLCQLLIGVRPIDRLPGSLLEAAAKGLDLDPPRPSRRFAALAPAERRRIAEERAIGESRLLRQLRGELDWIVSRAIAPEPDDRYGSVAELAADVERWLQGHPVAARPPSVVYRARKALRRHTAACTAAACVLVLGLVFAIRSHDLYQQTRAAQIQAEELVTFMLDDLSAQLEPLGRLDLLGAVSRESLAYFESSTAGQLARAGRRPAAALRQVGHVLATRGDLAAALEAYEKAREIDHHRWLEQPDALLPRLDLAGDLEQIGRLQQSLGNLDLAEAHLTTAERHLRHLVTRFPEHYPTHLALAKNLASFQAPLRRDRGETDTARELSDEALAMLHQLLEQRPHHVETQAALGNALYSRGLLELHAFGDAAAAAREFRSGAAVYRGLVRSRPEATRWRYRLAVLLGHGLTTANDFLGHLPAAQATNREALEIFEVLVREDPRHGVWSHGFGWELVRRAELAHQAGELGIATRALERSVRVQTDLLQRSIDPPTDWIDGAAFAQESLARLHAEHGELGAALAAAEAALATRRRIGGDDAHQTFYRLSLASAILRLGEIQLQRGDLPGASPRLHETRQILAGLQDTELQDALEPQELVEIQERLERAQERFEALL